MNEIQFWSPILGCAAMRLSLADNDGQEFFAIVPASLGRSYRETRQRVFVALDAAIENGDAPGEVKMDLVH